MTGNEGCKHTQLDSRPEDGQRRTELCHAIRQRRSPCAGTRCFVRKLIRQDSSVRRPLCGSSRRVRRTTLRSITPLHDEAAMRSIDRRLLLTSAVLAAATVRALHPELAKRVVTTDPRMGHGQLESIGAMTLILRTRAGGGSRTPVERQQTDYERSRTISRLERCSTCLADDRAPVEFSSRNQLHHARCGRSQNLVIRGELLTHLRVRKNQLDLLPQRIEPVALNRVDYADEHLAAGAAAVALMDVVDRRVVHQIRGLAA